MTHIGVLRRLKMIGLVDHKNRPITFNAFKNRSSVLRYGHEHKISYIGIPRINMWAFYFPLDNDSNYLKAAYAAFVKLVEGNMTYLDQKSLPFIKGGMIDFPKEYDGVPNPEFKLDLVD